MTGEAVVDALDCQSYFDLLKLPQPPNQVAVLESLAGDGLISRSTNGAWNISNLGAILLAKRLEDFPTLKRKAVRVIQYKGDDRLATTKEKQIARGYACGFESLTEYIDALLPEEEVVGRSTRRTTPAFPMIAVRELVANALIHQDFDITGAGPIIEVFPRRLEVTNPGVPLVDTLRFVDAPPRSRNDKLASLMRRFEFCEERGSGIDKVVEVAEAARLPAPRFEICEDNTRATLFARRSFGEMSDQDRVEACYLHACLRYVTSRDVTSASVRERFGLPMERRSSIARVLRNAVTSKKLVISGKDGPRIRYAPFWAA